MENGYFGHFVDFGVPLYTKSSQNGQKTPKESCIAKMVIFGYACFLRGFLSILMAFDDQRYAQNHQNGQNGGSRGLEEEVFQNHHSISPELAVLDSS